ncbi:MAG: DUF6596 domain-containing protein [Verrucomicrobiota bacterium]
MNPDAPNPRGLVEHFFRHETGRLHGALIRLLGVHNVSLAEDIAQEALLRAMRTWSMGGIPANPSAWITRVAMNLAKDALRHRGMAAGKEDAIAYHIEQTAPTPALAVEAAQTIRDDTLRLLFICCHPDIAPDAQVVLSLKIICGFGTSEIASAFLATESAIEKQLTRTKQRIQDAGIAYELPAGTDLSTRLDGVLGALYLLFNEGYKASVGDALLREDLCDEAIRLTSLLCEHPAGDTPRAHALLALMLLTSARFPSRVDEDGALLRLDQQDRSKWNLSRIDRGLVHLAAATSAHELSEYHLQAGIAALHCTAPDDASTDWPRILAHYDALLRLKPSPIIALNRVVALARVHGPRAGLDALATLPGRDRLEGNHLLHAVAGDLHRRLGDHPAAAASYRRALDLAKLAPEQALLARVLTHPTASDTK